MCWVIWSNSWIESWSVRRVFFRLGLLQSIWKSLVASENVSCAILTVIFSGSAFVTVDLGIFSKKDNVCVLGSISSITVEPGPASWPDPPPQAERIKQKVVDTKHLWKLIGINSPSAVWKKGGRLNSSLPWSFLSKYCFENLFVEAHKIGFAHLDRRCPEVPSRP